MAESKENKSTIHNTDLVSYGMMVEVRENLEDAPVGCGKVTGYFKNGEKITGIKIKFHEAKDENLMNQEFPFTHDPTGEKWGTFCPKDSRLKDKNNKEKKIQNYYYLSIANKVA